MGRIFLQSFFFFLSIVNTKCIYFHIGMRKLHQKEKQAEAHFEKCENVQVVRFRFEGKKIMMTKIRFG